MKTLRLLTGALALVLLLLPLRATAENIGVSPDAWDYGDVALGDSAVMSFTIESLGPDTELRIGAIQITDDDSGSFHIVSITPAFDFDYYLDVGETLEVVVSFTPGAEGLVTGSLLILSNAHTGSMTYIPLQGVGVDEEPTHSELMAALIAFFDARVADYSLYGLDNGNAPPAHLRVFEAMLDTADDLIAGATYFFTLATHERRPWLCTAPARGALREAIATVRQARPFAVEAWVLLPDHLHCIWTLPPGEADYATRWRLIKRAVSVRLAGEPDGTLSDSRRRRAERGLWQRRFWEHTIRDVRDFEAHCDYIHYNPVKHGLCSAPRDWPWSTFHRFVAGGLLPGHWRCEGVSAERDLRVGE